MKKVLLGSALLVLSGTVASAGNMTYTCDANVSSSICNYLNTTIAAQYNSTFTNAIADIYIQFGSTGLGASTQAYNFVTYTGYSNYLATHVTDNIQGLAAASLSNAAGPYGSDLVFITAGLGSAVGINSSALFGVNLHGGNNNSPGVCQGLSSASQVQASPSTACYNGIITVSNSQALYYDFLGGSQPANSYDFLAVVQHETDEMLGTSSCMSTQSTLIDSCDSVTGDTGGPSAIDLFRYNGLNNLALNSAYTGLSAATAGAYFSYNGGATNGANGFVYNVSANSQDYADFLGNCGSGSPATYKLSVQDAQGCPGHDAGLSILTDGGAELNMLNAIGYDFAAPEPGTMGLFGVAFAAFAAYKIRRRA